MRLLLPIVIAAALSHVIASAGEISFNRDVRPILSDRCFACHGPDENERKAKLRLDVAEGPDGAYRDDDGYFAIKPGSAEESSVWHRITTDDEDDIMPPPKSHKKPLNAEEQAIIKAWINAGAPYEDFWAFVAPTMPGLPEVKHSNWSDQPIDLHVMEKLESLDMMPAKPADKTTLIRRVTFDLTGLPPTLEEVRHFNSIYDNHPNAYEELVDQLLERDQFGEHMARYWLDLVRFADTNGMHKDFYRNFIAYRDWVIRSFNDNLGYDDFLRYQLAGDLYPNPTNDQLVATGFNRLHLIIDRGTALPEESFFKNVLDRVTAVGTVFMGMTAHCASCHDHKYDPLTMKDFYSLFAFFNNIDAEPETVRAPKDGLQPPFISMPTEAQSQRLAQLQKDLEDFEKWSALAKKSSEGAEKKQEAKTLEKELAGRRDALKKQREQLDREIPKAMVWRERKEVRPAFVMTRGNYEMPGDPVTRATPEFLPPMKKTSDVATRMDLANWFVAPENPLTARVAVNRFWQQFFGVGLVKTSEDLGAQGEIPSHPELLDYLAVSFVEDGWDIKALVKQIVMSKTYRQSSVATPKQFEADPENRLLARGSRFRMDAEMIRDQILATSGLLSTKMYGKSVKPPQPDGLWKAVTMIGERFKPDEGDAIYRRSVYTYWKRGMPPPQMTILNAPIRDACTARRERTNTPSQALLLLNESEYLRAARELALKALEQADRPMAERISYAYETITSRRPDTAEVQVMRNLADDLTTYYFKNPELTDAICDGVSSEDPKWKAKLATLTMIINTIYNLDITKTRQ